MIRRILLLLAAGLACGCSSPTSLQRAEAAYEAGNYDRAIAWSSKSIDEESGWAAAHLVRGKSYEKKGEHLRAIADYEFARRQAPDRGEPVLRQATCYMAVGRPADAEAAISGAIKKHYEEYSVRDRMLTHALHGEIQLATSDYSHASDSFDQALKVAHGSRPLSEEGTTAAVHYNLSRALYEQGAYPRARGSFQAYLQLQKRTGEAPRPQDLYTLTVLHFLCEDIDAAKAQAATLSGEYKTQADAILTGDTFSVRALYDLRRKPKEKDQDSDSNP